MSKIFFAGFFLYVASTIAFIVAILTPFWIIITEYRGIFEVCNFGPDGSRVCQYLLTYSSVSTILQYRMGIFMFNKIF